MRLLLTFILFILGGFYTFGKENYCEECCEYLENCCNKEEEEKEEEEKEEEEKEEEEKEEEEKEEVQGEFYLKRLEQDVIEKIKKLVNFDWYIAKKETASFILYEKINNIGNEGLNDNDVIKVTKDKNGFSIDKDFITEENNTKKWALFEIIYKEEKEGVEEEETVYLYCSDIENLDNCRIFYHCQQHVSISVIACDTSGVTNMCSMFCGCSSLTKLDLSNFNTEIVTNMSYMFSNCKKLKKLNLSEFDTKNVTDMSFMFSCCRFLTELDLSKFDTKNVTDMSDMFFKCSSLTELDLSKFDTKNVKKMSSMFSDCSSLHTVTFNKNLNEGIKQQLEILGLTESEEEGNKITLKKKLT